MFIVKWNTYINRRNLPPHRGKSEPIVGDLTHKAIINQAWSGHCASHQILLLPPTNSHYKLDTCIG
jgi:hypothetical protein